MKKISLLAIIVFACFLSGCDSISFKNNDKEQIEAAKAAAIADINKPAQTAIVDAEHKISSSATSKLGEASKEIESAIQNAQNAISIEVKKQATEEINDQLKNTQKQIEYSKDVARTAIFVGLIGILFGIVAIFLSIRAKNRSNSTRIRRIIYDAICNDSDIYERINHLISESQKSANRAPLSISKRDVERIIEEYIASKKFKDVLNQHVAAIAVQRPETSHVSKIDNEERTIAKASYQIFAKESTTMILSNIQDSYQKGKSIYKLTMSEPNASTAEVSICIEQEEVKQRILKFDSQYLEPICSVTRSSNEPSQVVIKTTGMAERVGEEWKVIKPITVEIK